MPKRKHASKKQTAYAPLPELLQRAIDETFASLTRPIVPGDGMDVATAYRKAIIANPDRLESVVLYRWRLLIEENDPACQKSHSEFWAVVREGYDRCNAELTEAGFPPPADDIRKWIRLAKVIEADPEFTNMDDLTETALTWAERETVRERIRQRVTAETSPAAFVAAYLGVVLNNRKASRLLDDVTLGPVEFGTKARPWELLDVLIKAGQAGVSCGDVQDAFSGKQYVHKSTLLALIGPLKLNIHTDGGMWRLVHLP